MTGWVIEGVIRCPGRCGLYFGFCGTVPELERFTAAHECGKERT